MPNLSTPTNGIYIVFTKSIDRIESSNCGFYSRNDNPSVDAGIEDQVLKDELYGRIMRGFVRRLDERRSWSVWR